MIQVENLLKIAVQNGASDIHLVCGIKPMLRIKKSLLELGDSEPLTKEDMEEVYRVVVEGNEEKDFKFRKTKMLDVSYELENIRTRVNVSLANDIPVFTIRIVKNEIPKFADLGIPDVVRRTVYQQQGLILVTGKTNSGKTTTLNALIDEINENQNRKILTLENPVEFRHVSKRSLIVQKEIGAGRDCITFADGVKNSLREDCDVLIIGEIRDKETVEAAIEMAETGHLVIGTIHTKSCAETVDRMIGFYDVKDHPTIKFLMSTLLKLVITQRLIKGIHGELVLIPEVMVVDNVMAGMIRKDKFSVSDIEDAIQTNPDKGNVGLITALAQAVLDGRITEQQADEQVDERNIEILDRTIRQLRQRQIGGVISNMNY